MIIRSLRRQAQQPNHYSDSANSALRKHKRAAKTYTVSYLSCSSSTDLTSSLNNSTAVYHGTTWQCMVNVAPRQLYPPKRALLTTVQEAGHPPESFRKYVQKRKPFRSRCSKPQTSSPQRITMLHTVFLLQVVVVVAEAVVIVAVLVVVVVAAAM